ncbi:hypothetical protein EIP91_011375 [Steccherinum ochraceum]|uniref:Uncharacterized protein n=1 Tax=Steccherinum ochraceum TaxID=92696 RepID=A0A4R0RMF1_9APHY|nr:hypothetical protein EIP91_011375 [Steccherinum ochraceum]
MVHNNSLDSTSGDTVDSIQNISRSLDPTPHLETTATGIWCIDRIGLSYHRPAGRSSSRFAIKVEGVSVELKPVREEWWRPEPGQDKTSKTEKSTPSALRQRITSFIRSVYDQLYWTLNPRVRPIVRAIAVAGFRLVIRALPTLVEAIDFELESAHVFFSTDIEARFSITRAQVDMKLTLEQLGCSEPAEKAPPTPARHKRFASVANLNTRLKSSVKRTWDRAWGGTEVAVAVAFSISAHFDPHRGVKQHSLETSLKVDPITVDLDGLIPVLNAFKRLRQKVERRAGFDKLPLSPVATPASGNAPNTATRSISPPPMSPKSIFRRPTSPTPSLSSLTNWRSSMGAKLSASIKFRRQPQPQVARKPIPDGIALSILKGIKVILPQLTVKHRFNCNGRSDVVSTTLQDISVGISRSHPERNQLHQEWIGRSSAPEDPFSADAYALSFSIHDTSMARMGSGAVRERLQVVAIGPLNIEAVVSQWPSPWLRGPTYLSGDPNNQWLLLQITLGSIDVSEHLEVLQALLTSAEPKRPSGSTPSLPPLLSPVPRIQLSIGVGPICARLISPASLRTDKPFAIEARTKGLIANMRSHFSHHIDKHKGKHPVPHDYPRLRMHLDFNLILERTFVNVCGSQWEDIPAAPGLPAGQPLLSLDEVHISATGEALGEVVEDPGMAVSIDVPSIFLDVSVATEALSVELWQPDAIGAITTVLQVVSVQRSGAVVSPEYNPHPKYALDSLPSGLSISFALSRAMVFITGPDLAPGEELEISRGVASHVGIAVTYCHLQPSQKDTASYHPTHEQQRLLLSLPSLLVSKAHNRISTVISEQSPMALIQVKAWDIAFRDALATRLVADDLFGVGDHHHHFRKQEYLNLQSIVADIVLSGHRQNGTALHGSKDNCAVAVTIAPISGTLHLANVYNALLALQTIKSLARATTASVPPRASPKPTSTLSVGVTCELSRLQLVYECPLSSKVYFRADTVFVEASPSQTIVVNWSSLVMAALLEVERDSVKHSEWEEILRLLDWRMVIQPDLNPVGIVVDGQSALIRLPFQFVLADLILNLNLSVKCVKHLLHMIPSGRFSTPPIPEAEGPKKMPDLVIRIGRLAAEAADEDIESRLALIWRAGSDSARLRLERDDAFEAKVAAIVGSGAAMTSIHGPDSDYQFSSQHSVSVGEARERLYAVHSGAWKSRFRQAHVSQHRRQESLCPKTLATLYSGNDFTVHVNPPSSASPLFRITFDGLSLHLARPSFPLADISGFLHAQGGLPRDTEYSLLIPMHLDLSVSSFRIALREYPLPLLNIPPHSQKDTPGLIFDTDLVIAEEMILSESGVQWVECAIVKAHRGIHGASPLSIAVPKTLNPVKTYATPIMRVTTDDVSDLSWGIGYSPAMQDFMRVVDTLSHSPRDSSPAIGFWDKLRLVFHWSVKVHFNDEVHLHLKGSRNPYDLRGSGAGFALCWKGHSHILIGQPNDQNELIQVVSDTMLITIPKPHYEVQLEQKVEVPKLKSPEDSYNGFRSDFIHLSISLTSSTAVSKTRNFSSIHLSPGLFSHFWAWWTLFDTISLPIRQGRRYKHKRPLSPKLGQHLATIKYRISVPKLFISHAYMDQSSDAWADGVTPFVGTKAMIDFFQVDMHQRAQETSITGPDGTTKTTMHKPFSAVEVVLKGLELRALLAIFSDPLKEAVPLECSPIGSAYRNRENIPVIGPDSPWIDLDDFVETDWSAPGIPILHLLPVMSCPRFTYFRHASKAAANENRVEVSKFDNEDTHLCLLGTEASVPQVQLNLVNNRIRELYELQEKEKKGTARPTFNTKTDIGKMITLLEDYAKHLAEVAATSRQTGPNGPHNYYMPSDSVSPEEWAEFQNVYQVHCPQIFMDNIIRDILIQYYYCSVARRGLEYHMATRAVKFIRDQAKTAIENLEAEAEKQPAASGAQAAAMAVRKMFIGESTEATIVQTDVDDEPVEAATDPMAGWDEGVFLRKSHFCLLLKPQIVLRSETSAESVLIMAAVQGKLQTYAIMDITNADDPNQTDLIRFHVPRFTVSANDRHFGAISNIVTDLLLFSNAALKTRSDRLEKMLFSYDFTNVASAADVVADLQARLRHAVEIKREAEWKLLRYGEDGDVEKLKIMAHILLLSEELDYVFDAIKLAQDKVNNRTGQNSALLLHASSAEISWRMLDRVDQLLAKLAVREIDFRWLSRQDSSVVNNLAVGDLQAFDGAADAEWTEILSKFEEKSNHPLVKQKLFCLADWTVLPPVGGITIYEAFDLSFHPMCLQIDTRVGKKIMEYVWPSRRNRGEIANESEDSQLVSPPSPTSHPVSRPSSKRASMDIVSPTPRRSMDSNRLTPLPLRRLNTSRSFTDLRGERSEPARSDTLQVHRPLARTRSSDGLFALSLTSPSPIDRSNQPSEESHRLSSAVSKKSRDDAAEMKTRSSQKTFVWVRVSSLHLVLSILKEDSFLCRDARIKTRDLEYRNQTCSWFLEFEELVDQFIPSGKNWKGWVKIAFQQPLVPVLPVARELITKTKWGAPKTHHQGGDTVKRKTGTKRLPFVTHRDTTVTPDTVAQDRSDPSSRSFTPSSSSDVSAENLTGEPEAMREEDEHRKRPRTRVMSLFKRSRSKPRSSMDSDVSIATTASSQSVNSVPALPVHSGRPSGLGATGHSEESMRSTQSSVV